MTVYLKLAPLSWSEYDDFGHGSHRLERRMLEQLQTHKEAAEDVASIAEAALTDHLASLIYAEVLLTTIGSPDLCSDHLKVMIRQIDEAKPGMSGGLALMAASLTDWVRETGGSPHDGELLALEEKLLLHSLQTQPPRERTWLLYHGLMRTMGDVPGMIRAAEGYARLSPFGLEGLSQFEANLEKVITFRPYWSEDEAKELFRKAREMS